MLIHLLHDPTKYQAASKPNTWLSLPYKDTTSHPKEICAHVALSHASVSEKMVLIVIALRRRSTFAAGYGMGGILIYCSTDRIDR